MKRISKSKLTATFTDTECPKCGGIAKIYDDWMLSEETTECPACGYQRRISTDEQITETDGYGCIYIEYLNKPYYFESFEEPLNKDEIQKRMDMFNTFSVKEKSYFYLYDPKRNSFQVLKGSAPQSFNDWIIEEQEKMEYERELYFHRNCDISSEDCTLF